MGTRSLTVFVDQYRDEESQKLVSDEIVVMYRQMDGYPTGHGQELADFLKQFTFVNGISGDEKHKVANGMSCLAGQTIAHFKTGVGGFYLHKAGTRDAGEEFIYTVYPGKDGEVNLKVTAGAVTFFGLPGTKEANMPVLYDGPVKKFNAKKAEKIGHGKSIPNDFLDGNPKKRKKTPKLLSAAN